MDAYIQPDIPEARKKEYPSKGEQLDALWKIVRQVVQTNPEAFDPGAIDVMNKVFAVKTRLPKRPR